MRSIAKVLLVGAVAVMAIAVSAAPSEAAKKKAAPKAASPAAGTYIGQACSAGGKVMVWGPDQKWSPSMFGPMCTAPFCPPAC